MSPVARGLSPARDRLAAATVTSLAGARDVGCGCQCGQVEYAILTALPINYSLTKSAKPERNAGPVHWRLSRRIANDELQSTCIPGGIACQFGLVRGKCAKQGLQNYRESGGRGWDRRYQLSDFYEHARCAFPSRTAVFAHAEPLQR